MTDHAEAARLFAAWARETGYQPPAASSTSRLRGVALAASSARAAAVVPGGPTERTRADETSGLSWHERRLQREAASAGIERALASRQGPD